MGRLITMRDGEVVEDAETPDPPEPDTEAEIADLKERLAATLKERLAASRRKR